MGSVGKKGFYDMEDFFAVLVYTLILFLFIVLISLPMCTERQNLELKGSSTGIDALLGNQLLLEMLRTPLPHNLPEVIAEQKGKKIYSNVDAEIYHGLDEDAAINLLTAELYKDKTYSEFLDNLHFLIEEADRNNLFAVVTRAAFIRQVNDAYAYPEAYVKYGAAGEFGEADLSNDIPELKGASPAFGRALIRRRIGEAYAIFPLKDKRVASIKMTVRESLK